MSINEKLKACPFCGDNPKTAVNYSQVSVGDLFLNFSVVCPTCKTKKTVCKEVEGKDFKAYVDAMGQAIELWNRRV